jgi:hypothetical protein
MLSVSLPLRNSTDCRNQNPFHPPSIPVFRPHQTRPDSRFLIDPPGHGCGTWMLILQIESGVRSICLRQPIRTFDNRSRPDPADIETYGGTGAGRG